MSGKTTWHSIIHRRSLPYYAGLVGILLGLFVDPTLNILTHVVSTCQSIQVEYNFYPRMQNLRSINMHYVHYTTSICTWILMCTSAISESTLEWVESNHCFFRVVLPQPSLPNTCRVSRGRLISTDMVLLL